MPYLGTVKWHVGVPVLGAACLLCSLQTLLSGSEIQLLLI